MTLRTRLRRLETRHGIRANRPDVTCILLRTVYEADPESGGPESEVACAMIWTRDGWGSLTREAGETAEAFTARATSCAEAALRLSDNRH